MSCRTMLTVIVLFSHFTFRILCTVHSRGLLNYWSINENITNLSLYVSLVTSR